MALSDRDYMRDPAPRHKPPVNPTWWLVLIAAALLIGLGLFLPECSG